MTQEPKSTEGVVSTDPTGPELGRNVKNGDVLPHAKARCKFCFGRGELRDLDRGVRICGCALARFLAANGAKCMAAPDGLRWEKAHEPATDFVKAEIDVRAEEKSEPIQSDSAVVTDTSKETEK